MAQLLYYKAQCEIKSNESKKVNVILKMINPYIESHNAREKMQWSSQNWSERLKLPTLHRYYWRYSRKELLIRKNLMSEGGEGGADRQNGQPDYLDSEHGRSFSYLLSLVWGNGGGAALAIMGLEWTGGGAHETFDKHTWSIWTVGCSVEIFFWSDRTGQLTKGQA